MQQAISSGSIHRYFVSLLSIDPDEDNSIDSEKFVLSFPKKMEKTQIKTLLTLMGWLRNYRLDICRELDLNDDGDLEALIENDHLLDAYCEV